MPDYRSSVPRFTFSDSLAAQERELAANPLLERFRASRRELARDRHVPRYHFLSPENRLNDPNGLCRWQGRWHLFYQGYPPEDPRQHWGHAVSDDLIHWRDLPYAIYPDPERCCFSGATLVEDDRVIACYHGTEAGTMVATSSDPLLLNWNKVTGKPVIPLAGPNDPPLPYAVFDPCIWKQGGRYYSLSGGTLPHPPAGKVSRADFLFRSDDLAHWEYLHPFDTNDRFSLAGDDGACPYFWPIGADANRRHALLYFSHMSGGKYLIGDYDTERDKLLVTAGGRFNFGSVQPGGVHAPSATPDGDGGLIAIFNMNPAKPTRGWDQVMSLPRRLKLAEYDGIEMEPTGDIASLRGRHVRVGPAALPANRDVVLQDVNGASLEIAAVIDPQDAPTVEIDVLRSPRRQEYTRIAFYRQRGYRNRERYAGPDRERSLAAGDSLITLDNTRSSELPDVLSRAPETAPVYVGPDEPLALRIFIDRSLVEVFANGRQCVALRVYPGRADSTGVSLRACGSGATLRSLDAWQMGSIYDS